MEQIHVTNKTMELADCGKDWTRNEEYGCYCLEDILYTPVPTAPRYQRLSIFVPEAYMTEAAGMVSVKESASCGRYTPATAPVIFENNAAGYAQMEHTWLGGPRNYARQYLKRGMIYVTCGCRGRQTAVEDGSFIGKSPATLVDFKTAIRFLRHNRNTLPGNMEHIISVGWSAGGAMSALLGCSGNSSRLESYLKENGAFLEETDDVFAAQVYCPITDLEHADMAYEWQFAKDMEYEASPFAPGGTLTGFQRALSRKLAQGFVAYFNGMELRDPTTGELLTIGSDLRSGTGYQFLMGCLEDSASVYLNKLAQKDLPAGYSPEDYLAGNYTYEGVDPKKLMEVIRKMEEKSKQMPSGKTPSDGPEFEGHGMRLKMPEMPTRTMQGNDKRSWLSWDGSRAKISSLDAFLMASRRRMKTCPSFDFLDCTSGENQEFGDACRDYVHFNPSLAGMIAELREEFPQEYETYYPAYAAAKTDEGLAMRLSLLNPFHYIDNDCSCQTASHFRINVGAQDADTSFMVSIMLALKLSGRKDMDVQYHLYWDQPHSEADYPGQVCDWIEAITC